MIWLSMFGLYWHWSQQDQQLDQWQMERKGQSLGQTHDRACPSLICRMETSSTEKCDLSYSIRVNTHRQAPQMGEN